MFHRVLPGSEISYEDAYWLRGTLISTEYLRAVIQRFYRMGYEFLTLKEAVKRTCRERVVVCTFDDGYVDNYIHAVPVLDDFGIKASFYPIFNYCVDQSLAPLDMYYHFVNLNVSLSEKFDWISGERKRKFLSLTIEDQINYTSNFLFSGIDTQPNLRYMTIDELKALHLSGHEIGGHSLNHAIYPTLTSKAVKAELQILQNEFKKHGIRLETFAYPDGQYDMKSILILHSLGFEAACTIKSAGLLVNSDFEVERDFVDSKYLIHATV